ncbi:MAG TPA: SgcJ/EcaC family oxidoreductase [Chryseolinea sp.]|nr:SgcJ/EcaC family oxidoreductase [Chryseolinea sp.]
MKTADNIAWNKQEEIDSIMHAMSDFEKHANNHQPEKAAEFVSQNAVIVNVVGIRLTGKDEFYQFIKKAMQGRLANLVRKNEVKDIQFLRPDIAVISATQVASTREGSVLKEHGSGAMTVVLTKEDGKWLVAVAQNTMIGEWNE